MSMNSYQKEVEKAILRRIGLLSRQKQPLRFRMNDEDILEFNVGELVNINEGRIVIEFGEVGLKKKGNLIGLSGVYYSPKFLGADNIQNVFTSWEWLMRKMQIDSELFQEALEANFLIELLALPIEDGLLVYVLSLAVDLYLLDSLGVNTDSKIAELGKKARDHLRKYEKLKDKRVAKGLFAIRDLKFYFADLSSECRLARLAKSYGFEVKLGIHPDLIINNRTVEVKRVRRRYGFVKSEIKMLTGSLSNPVKRGLKQDADLVAVEVNSLEKRAIKDFKNVWMGRTGLRSALVSALSYRKNGDCILLFLGTTRGYFGRIVLVK